MGLLKKLWNHVVAVTATDPATGVSDLAYVVTRSSDWRQRLGSLKLKARVCTQVMTERP